MSNSGSLPLSSNPSYFGGGSSEAAPNWMSELYGMEPLSSDPAYEFYEGLHGSSFTDEDIPPEEPPSEDWVDETSSMEDEREMMPLEEFLEEWLGEDAHQQLVDNRSEDQDSEEDDDVGSDISAGADEEFIPNRPNVLPEDVLRRSLEDAGLPPLFFCAVCCRLLYTGEDMHQLEYIAEEDLANIAWPCRDYGREPTTINGRLMVCNNHRRLNDETREF
ncbi:hypothetical protein BGZ74_005193, partial [Mortierella antarctica]